MSQLLAGALPAEMHAMLNALLYRPDRNTLEWKALEEASAQLKLTPTRAIARSGGLPSTHDYHLNRFIFEHFPLGTRFSGPDALAPVPSDLPLADAVAFSIDDASTTEIDDAFSVTSLGNGNTRVGIHIAAPALGIAADSPLDHAARSHLSTVYFPGGKITMLPDSVIEAYTLASGRSCPALSLYAEVNEANQVVNVRTLLERVNVVGNLRHDTLEPVFNEATVSRSVIEHDYGHELKRLWGWAKTLEQARRGDAPATEQRPEFSFSVENDRVQIVPRRRGTPMDMLVAELMIFVNSTWGRQLAETGSAAIFRVQGAGKVRMSTVPAAHAGLGVDHYVWASSPLRRYIDLLNQRQLVAIARGETPPYKSGDQRVLAVMREFESAYESYAEFQRSMERYWSLRWLLQENARVVQATVLRENLCRFDELPLLVRVASLPGLGSGTQVLLDISDIDLLELTFHCEFAREVHAPEPASAGSALAAAE